MQSVNAQFKMTIQQGEYDELKTRNEVMLSALKRALPVLHNAIYEAWPARPWLAQTRQEICELAKTAIKRSDPK